MKLRPRGPSSGVLESESGDPAAKVPPLVLGIVSEGECPVAKFPRLLALIRALAELLGPPIVT